MLFGFSSNSLAYTILNGAIDVGALHNFLVGADLGNSSTGDETEWVNQKLNELLSTTKKYTFAGKMEFVDAESVDDGLGGLIDNSADGAFRLEKAPAYFLVKKGSIQNSEDGNSHWLFDNTASLNWGVVVLRNSLTTNGLMTTTSL